MHHLELIRRTASQAIKLKPIQGRISHAT
jgi:hypothetical protein